MAGTILTSKQIKQDITQNLEQYVEYLSNKIEAGFTTGEMSIGDIKFSSNPTAQPGWLPFGNEAMAMSTYPEAWAVIGKKFELSNRLAGRPASPDFYFYATPPSDNVFIRSTISSLAIDPVAMVSGNITTISAGHKITRVGTAFYVEEIVPLATGQLNAFTLYYTRRLNDTEFSIHATEDNAINNTSPLAGIAANSTLHFVGVFQLSALQNHTHLTNASLAPNVAAGTDLSLSTALDSQDDILEESQRKIGEPLIAGASYSSVRYSNETRPTNISLFGFVKVAITLQSATEITSTRFITEWEPVVNFSGTTFQYFHGLNANLSELIVKVMVSASGEETSSYEASNFSLFGIDDDNIEIRFGTDGASYINNAGSIVNIANEGWSIKLVIYRPEVLKKTTNSNFFLVDVPNAANVIFNVPRAVLWNTPIHVIKKGVGLGEVVLQFFGDENETGVADLRITGMGNYVYLYPYVNGSGNRVWGLFTDRLNATPKADEILFPVDTVFSVIDGTNVLTAIADLDIADTQNVKLTGDQTIDGIKTFSSTISGSIDGNAATVSNGVYTTGDQSIAGIKTFSHIKIPLSEPVESGPGTIWVDLIVSGGP